jgi:CHAD domain-containing protein
MLAAVNDLQDLLGSINDCATAPELLDQATRLARGPMRVQARAIVSHWNSSQLEERKRELPAAWKAFRQADRFWR